MPNVGGSNRETLSEVGYNPKIRSPGIINRLGTSNSIAQFSPKMVPQGNWSVRESSLNIGGTPVELQNRNERSNSFAFSQSNYEAPKTKLILENY